MNFHCIVSCQSGKIFSLRCSIHSLRLMNFYFKLIIFFQFIIFFRLFSITITMSFFNYFQKTKVCVVWIKLYELTTSPFSISLYFLLSKSISWLLYIFSLPSIVSSRLWKHKSIAQEQKIQLPYFPLQKISPLG